LPIETKNDQARWQVVQSDLSQLKSVAPYQVPATTPAP